MIGKHALNPLGCLKARGKLIFRWKNLQSLHFDQKPEEKRLISSFRKVCNDSTKKNRSQANLLFSQSTLSRAKHTEPPTKPTWRQLGILALRSAIPMVGFGFMDNLVMIEAGEMIDLSLGVTFALSTLTAAGFGQCVSDVAGLTCGGIVDAIVSKLNLPHHCLTPTQLGMKCSRITITAGGSVGVVFGCLLGMTTLIFKDTDKADRLKKAKELDSIFQTVMKDTNRIVSAERCSLWLIDKEGLELWTKFASGTEETIHVSKNKGVVGACVRSGHIVNIHDAYKDDRFNADVDKETGFRTRSIIAVPVKDSCNGSVVIGVIELMNKKNDDGTDGVFDVNDAKLLTMLSCHVSQFIRVVGGGVKEL